MCVHSKEYSRYMCNKPRIEAEIIILILITSIADVVYEFMLTNVCMCASIGICEQVRARAESQLLAILSQIARARSGIAIAAPFWRFRVCYELTTGIECMCVGLCTHTSTYKYRHVCVRVVIDTRSLIKVHNADISFRILFSFVFVVVIVVFLVPLLLLRFRRAASGQRPRPSNSDSSAPNAVADPISDSTAKLQASSAP